MATIFKRGSKGSWIIQYFDAQGRRRERSSRTTDYRAAERIAAKLAADVALRRDGVVDPGMDRLADENRKPIGVHLAHYLDHCRHVGLAAKSVEDKETLLSGLFASMGATRLSDLTLDRAERALSAARETLAARTVNRRREIILAFANWCRKTGRLDANPLALLPRLDQDRDRRRVRRALTDAEVGRLMAVAEKHGRKAWYVAALLAGLRRSDLMRMTWGDVDLDAAVLTIRDGKAKREDRLPIHPDLLSELRRIRPTDVLPSARVFRRGVANKTRQKDFTAAKIAPDEQGRVADLHALRGTLGTRLARQGIAPQVAQQLMRHSDYRLTLKHYTHLTLSDAADAMNRLPGVVHAQEGAQAQATGTDGDCQQIPQQPSHETARVGAVGRDEGDTDEPAADLSQAPRGARVSDATRERAQPRRRGRAADRGGLENRCPASETPGNAGASDDALPTPSTFPSTRPPETDRGLVEVIDAWNALPETIRIGILAMVRAGRQGGPR